MSASQTVLTVIAQTIVVLASIAFNVSWAETYDECSIYSTCEKCLEAFCEFEPTSSGKFECLSPIYSDGSVRVVRSVTSHNETKCPSMITTVTTDISQNQRFYDGIDLSLSIPSRSSGGAVHDENWLQIPANQHSQPQLLLILTISQCASVILLVIVSFAIWSIVIMVHKAKKTPSSLHTIDV